MAEATLPILLTLVRKSLLRREANERYSLHSLVQHYAAEQLALAAVERVESASRHSHFYASLLQKWRQSLRTERLHELPTHWEAEIENMRGLSVGAGTARLGGPDPDGGRALFSPRATQPLQRGRRAFAARRSESRQRWGRGACRSDPRTYYGRKCWRQGVFAHYLGQTQWRGNA
ncbi:MAG: hypothetical protein R2911_32070 [Caldilineaceae bacterium]